LTELTNKMGQQYISR